MSTKQAETNLDTTQEKQLNSRLQECPIAIVGMSSIFAESKNIEQFWDNIVESVNGIKDVPEDRWAIDDYYSADKKEADKTYCKRGGFLPEIDFDPMEFGLPPNLLELTDIAQLMSLVAARDVLADAGISEESAYDRDKIGITLGVGGGQKQIAPLTSRLQGPVLNKVLKASGVNEADREMIIEKYKKAYIPWEENSFPGMLGNVIAGRIANRFNFGGTNCVVDAACAGSLAAIKMAVSDLLEYRSEMMISGGVCCDNSPFMYMSFSKTPAFTDGDNIRPFDENSNGMMIGEGVGMIAMKRLEDAERDGDKIYSVIKGIGSSSDGRFKSIYAPRPSGQVKALKRAYDDAGFDPLTCGLIEAHGTGTKAGDAAEFAGLTTMFSENNEQKQHIALGTVKSQVGHTKAAAGTAGLIKACLALHHKVLPATINVDKPNQNLDIDNTPLYINNETRPWMPRADAVKRRAGVSSFGFGGTNFHIVLEEYQTKHAKAYRLNEVAQSIIISAQDKSQLQQSLKTWKQKLDVEVDLQSFAFNALVTENPLTTPSSELARCGFVAKNAAQAIQAIEQILNQFATDNADAWSKPTGIYYRESGLDAQGKIVALFSGQGSQYVNMGRDLTCNFPSMLDTSSSMDSQFTDNDQQQLSSVVFPIPVFSAEKRSAQDDVLRLTQNAQPAIGTFSVGLYKTFQQAGFKADFAAGHSFGELTALWAAGVVSDTDYMTLARSRGQAMAAPEDENFDAGTMVAVVGAPDKVAADIEHIKDVSIANYNSNNQVVIAGVTTQVLVAFEELKAKGYKVVQLPVSAAFHTDLVSHAQKPFADVIDNIEFKTPSIPVFANGTAKAHAESGAEIKETLKNHILQSVHFNEEIDNLYDAGGRIFVEFGPKNVLTRLVDNILIDKNDVVTIAVNANPKKSADLQLRLAALEMAVLGVQLDDIDPYNATQRPTVPAKKSPLAMKLTGAAYVSAKTKKKFEEALNDGQTISNAQPKIVENIIHKEVAVVKEVIKEVIVEKIVEKIVYVQADGTPLANQQAAAANATNTSHGANDLVQSIEQSVAQFVNHQSQLLDVHEEYMQGPKEYAKTFKDVLATQSGVTELPESLDKTLGMYHDFQSETLRVHEAYLNKQTENLQQVFATTTNNTVATAPVARGAQPIVQTPAAVQQPVQQAKAAPIVTATATAAPVAPVAVSPQVVQHAAPKQQVVKAVAPAPVVDLTKIQSVMMDVVADKTGYPAEMLELGMDMEADLGIDSIKRVEILGAVQDEISDLPELNPEDLAELRTLGEIVTYMQSKAQTTAPVASVTNVAAAPAIDLTKIQSVMMDVVADKTGYPAEMLELSMDMEADLGIDSIKRVEILGAVQDEISDLPELNPEDLAELRTLGEIVTYMQSKAQSAAPVASVANVAAAPAIDLTKIQSVMMEVVADKTGYPAEMLELSMDMEADLGIDSIKRVEILGAVQDEITDLPELNPEDLAELRTLGEIVSYMQSKAQTIVPAAAVSETAPVVATATIDLSKIQSVMMAVVADKTGYPAEMLELGMDMEADLGIDSIKRVEILGAVQDEITDLPELNPEDLAELRTLGEIVSYMQSKASALAPATTETTAVVIDLNKIQAVMMSVVADKTGYPSEMLELSMDMEADLGIDSIKRVEILGAVQDEITDLPELNPEALAELRTLGQIVNYMTDVAKATAGDTPVKKSEALSEQSKITEISNNFEPAPSAIVKVQHLEAVEKLSTNVNGENLLLVDDGEGASVRLAEKLSQQGWSVSVIQPSWVKSNTAKKFNDKVNLFALNEVNEQELNTILQTQSVWTSVVYLQPKTKIAGIEYPQATKQGLMLAFLLAKLSGLGSNKNNDARSSFVVLTRQGGTFGVDNNELESDLVQTGLTGLVKTIAHEWPSVFCRVIDVATKFAADKVANIVVDELADANFKPVEVGFNKNGRLTLVAEKTDSYALTQGNSIDQDSVFLVSGGAKGVTAHCVIRLAQTYKSKFILLGRSSYQSDEPSWANSVADEVALKKAAMQHLIATGEKPTPVVVSRLIRPVLANREIKQTLDAISAAGGIAEYISADVTDSKSVQAAVSPITDVWGEITGLIHGAGVLADKFIEQKTLADFEAVYSTKIDGLISMLATCQQDKLKHLVLFSSAAGFYGNPGQSDYSIANDILNKTAYRFKALHPQTQVLSFNWGPWDGGMVTAELKRMFNDRGVYIIPLDAGAQLLVSELAADSNRCPQILVGNDMGGEAEQEETVKKPLVSRLSKNLLAANNPFIADHKIGSNQVFPTVCAIAWMVEAAQTIYPDYVYLGLQNYKLFKGIIFDGTQSDDYSIDMNLVVEDTSGLQVEFKISSENNGRTIFHYAATLFLGQHKKPTPEHVGELPSLVSNMQQSAAVLYENGTLFHGDSLQGIHAIHECDQNGLLMSCLITASAATKQGQFDLNANNVLANDLVYQAMLVWVREQLGLGSLPTSTLAWTVYSEVVVDQAFYLKLNVIEKIANKVIADIQLIDQNKQVMAEISAAEVTSSASLNDLFSKREGSV
ncbi:MAG: SDR family NAD(P)-dependent oxidoreductase [Psychromonas sp.]